MDITMIVCGLGMVWGIDLRDVEKSRNSNALNWDL